MTYRRVDICTWDDEKFIGLNNEERLLWLFLLTGPQTTNLPGVMIATPEGLASRCFFSPDSGLEQACGRAPSGGLPDRQMAFGRAFETLEKLGRVRADWRHRLVWVPRAFRRNKPESPSAAMGWASRISELPKCPLRIEIFEAVCSEAAHWPGSFQRAWDVATADLRQVCGRSESGLRQPPVPVPVPGGAGAAGRQLSMATGLVVVGDDKSSQSQKPPPAVDVLSADFEGDAARSLWETVERIRADADLTPEGKPPNWATWAHDALGKCNADGIERAYVRYLGDDHWADRNWAIRLFQAEAVWTVRTGPARAAKGGGWR